MRVLFVEDEPDLAQAIKQTLTREKYIVDWVLDGSEALDLLHDKSIQYTLAIFDWMIPKVSGLELCQKLRAQNNPLPILILTAKDRIEDKVAGLDAGGDDYLIKPFKMDELLARLRALHRRSPHFNPPRLSLGSLTLDYATKTVIDQKQNAEIPLTNKEFQLLEYFIKHPNQILTTEQIRYQLWEINSESISNVVAAQIRLLRRKLSLAGYHDLIQTLHGLGYRLNFNNEG